jgi:hypothetical protein
MVVSGDFWWQQTPLLNIKEALATILTKNIICFRN